MKNGKCQLLKMIRLACSNAYDDVEDFEICGIHKNTEIQMSRERNIFSSNKKILQLHIKGYFMAKNKKAATRGVL